VTRYYFLSEGCCVVSQSQSQSHVTTDGQSVYLGVKITFKVKVMLRLVVSQSACLGVKITLELVTRYYFLSESCCVVSVGRPL
jgi:hypothetical protein